MAKIIGTQEEENKMGRLSWFQPVKLILFVEIFHQKKKKKTLLYTLFKNGEEGRKHSKKKSFFFSKTIVFLTFLT